MKFTLTADALADATTFASKGLNPRPAIPILAGLLIEAQTGGLRISGFDYEKSARTQVAADVTEPGKVLLQGKMFTDIIRKFGKKTVTVSVDDRKATITAGSAVFTMHPMPAAEFPPMPDLPASAGTIDGDVFAAAVAQVIGAASTDASVPVLMGVKILSEGNDLIMLTTDRYRLAEVVIPWQPTGEDIDILVRASWLQDVVKTLAGDATLLADGNLVGIRTGNRATTQITMDGDYPKIKALFPNTTATQVSVDRDEFADVLSRVALVAERNTPVRLTTADGVMTVEAGTGEDAQGQETLPCEVDGDDVTAAFNPGYLAWSLAVTPAAAITIGFQENLGKPALVYGADGLRHLLMPVRLPA
ncbi:DNA polymerase III subunit beta [Arthrobacter sp. ISL-69]|uniref:DNA polymerase III subunit beta n=1 Tax=Arthrobacter sp. ISL-69 TaxID=2819113 RepID=UPI001BE90ADB|nr:DNA polymerase III subunit beta [Arthrobacter sp. ISL-69]MBT2537243.1 DNA polymerase III subunit beta [Arthrobacter sp. ISL-69]